MVSNELSWDDSFFFVRHKDKVSKDILPAQAKCKTEVIPYYACILYSRKLTNVTASEFKPSDGLMINFNTYFSIKHLRLHKIWSNNKFKFLNMLL